MRTLIVGDSHIDDKHLNELEKIFNEILSIDADNLIHLGDYYDNNKLSPKEVDFGTKYAIEFTKKYKSVTILDGNGSHQFYNGKGNTDYLQRLGIHTPGRDYQLVREGKNIFCSHIMTNESYKEYGSHEYTVADLMKYDIVLLGHQHNPQEIRKDKIYHVGSIFYSNFNEAKDDHKQIALIENGILSFIPLKSPIPMKDVYSLEELKAISVSEPQAKVRLIFSSFAQFKREVPLLKAFKDKFVDFKTKLDFEKSFIAEEPQQSKEAKKGKTLQELLKTELAKIQDEDVKKLLEDQFKEEK